MNIKNSQKNLGCNIVVLKIYYTASNVSIHKRQKECMQLLIKNQNLAEQCNNIQNLPHFRISRFVFDRLKVIGKCITKYRTLFNLIEPKNAMKQKNLYINHLQGNYFSIGA